jgi:hypothetical protein
MLNKIRHLFWSIVLRRSYRKSKDKDKQPLYTNSLNMIRLQYFARAKAEKWNYKSDKLWGLVNRIAPPTFSTEIDTGDCDDYASAVLGQYENTDNAYLFTYFCKPLIKSHTVPVFKRRGQFVTFNWGRVYVVPTIRELIELYESLANVEIKSTHFAQWSEKKYRYVMKKING